MPNLYGWLLSGFMNYHLHQNIAKITSGDGHTSSVGTRISWPAVKGFAPLLLADFFIENSLHAIHNEKGSVCLLSIYYIESAR